MTRSAGDIESSELGGTKGGLMIAVVCGFIRSRSSAARKRLATGENGRIRRGGTDEQFN